VAHRTHREKGLLHKHRTSPPVTVRKNTYIEVMANTVLALAGCRYFQQCLIDRIGEEVYAAKSGLILISH
jgi:hypothetical protein